MTKGKPYRICLTQSLNFWGNAFQSEQNNLNTKDGKEVERLVVGGHRCFSIYSLILIGWYPLGIFSIAILYTYHKMGKKLAKSFLPKHRFPFFLLSNNHNNVKVIQPLRTQIAYFKTKAQARQMSFHFKVQL